MPNAITAIFGADASQFAASIKLVETEAIASQARIAKATALLKGPKAAIFSPYGSAPQASQAEAAALTEFQRIEARKAQESVKIEELIKQTTIASAAARTAAEMGSIETIMAADEVATAKRLSEIAMLRAASKTGGVQSSLFGNAHGSGGVSGVVRESFVLIREALRGNWSRMVGSITLLAQYTGTLGKVLKSTASESILFADAQRKEAASMARSAVAAEAKATATMEAATAEEFNVEALNAEAEAAEMDAVAQRAAAVAQVEKAQAATEAAESEAAAATVALGPIGWVIAALLSLGIALYAVFKIHKTMAEEEARTDIIMGNTNATIKDQTDAWRECQKAIRDYAKAVRDAHDSSKSLTEQSELQTQAINDQFDSANNLADAKDQQAKSDIDLAEAEGKITKQQAIEQKSAVDEQALRRKSSDEQLRLIDLAVSKKQAAIAAQKALEAATNAANKAAKISINPNRDARIKSLQDIVNKGKQSHWYQFGTQGRVNTAKYDSAKAELEGLQKLKERSEENMQATEKTMSEAGNQNKQLQQEASEAEQKSSAFNKNNPSILAAQEAALDDERKKALLEASQSGPKGFSLNSNQRIGAYAATPPDWAILIASSKETAQNTRALRGDSRKPVGSTPLLTSGRAVFTGHASAWVGQ